MVAGIAIDNWKLDIFERRLAEAGYTFIIRAEVTGDMLLLKVEADDLKSLEIVVRMANEEAAQIKRQLPS